MFLYDETLYSRTKQRCIELDAPLDLTTLNLVDKLKPGFRVLSFRI